MRVELTDLGCKGTLSAAGASTALFNLKMRVSPTVRISGEPPRAITTGTGSAGEQSGMPGGGGPGPWTRKPIRGPGMLERWALACVPLLLAGAAAAAEGYWECRGSDWTAVDAPTHPMPLKECGAVPRTAPTSAESCTDQGGKWGAIGIFPAPVCSLPTRDALRPCGDSNECEGLCLAELSAEERRPLMRGEATGLSRLGKCAARVPVMGCVAKVERGVVRRVICFD